MGHIKRYDFCHPGNTITQTQRGTEQAVTFNKPLPLQNGERTSARNREQRYISTGLTLWSISFLAKRLQLVQAHCPDWLSDEQPITGGEIDSGTWFDKIQSLLTRRCGDRPMEWLGTLCSQSGSRKRQMLVLSWFSPSPCPSEWWPLGSEQLLSP